MSNFIRNLSILLMLPVIGIAVAGCDSPEPTSDTSLSNTSPTSTSPTSTSEFSAQSSDAPAPATNDVKTIQVDYAGFEEQIKKQNGKLVVVDVWSTGCPPCMREYPNLVALSSRFADQVVCISYNVDYIGLKSKPVESYLPKVGGFLAKQKSFNVINLISSEADSDVFEKLEIASIPVIMLFDRDGKLIKKFTEANSGEDGLSYESDIIPAVETALK